MPKTMDCGVYVIENTVNGRKYVGSAMRLSARKKEHWRQLTQGKHHSRFLQRAWNKYGADCFVFKCALYCDKGRLIFYEQTLIDFYKPDYNSAPKAGSQLGFKMSEESKAKLSAAAKRTKNFTGKWHTDESKKKISESRKGKGGGPRSQERLAKISAALKGRRHSDERKLKISKTLHGTSTGRGSLSEDQVRQVRVLRSQGLGYIRIAKAMGISQWAADAVIGGHAYLWVK